MNKKLYKLYVINSDGVEYIQDESNEFYLSLYQLRSDMKRIAIRGWKIVRNLDGKVLAQYENKKL